MSNQSIAAKPVYASLYPEEWGTFPYSPTTENFAVIEDEGRGKALVTRRTFEAGETVFAFRGVLMHEQTLHTLQLTHEGWFLHDPYASGLMIHDCDPNVEVCMEKQTTVARKHIEVGDIITMDYDTTEDELFRSFRCLCGAAECRGIIRGKNPRDI